MSEIKMFYFGPWDQAGHYMRSDDHPPQDLEGWRAVSHFTYTNPWGRSIDGSLAPPDTHMEGFARVHHKDGWTALSFWDRTIDSRPGSHSTYLAEGYYTFDQMVEFASKRFAERWNRMPFAVVEHKVEKPS